MIKKYLTEEYEQAYKSLISKNEEIENLIKENENFENKLMGACESSKEKEKILGKKFSPPEIINNNNIIEKNTSINEDDNLNGVETHPSSNSQENEIKIPELSRYDRDCKTSELSNNTKLISAYSSQKEEEVIIRGEVNKKIINKEGDFDNKDFRNLVKNNGGIIIKDDKMSNVLSYQGINPSLDIGTPNSIYESRSINIPYRKANDLTTKLQGGEESLNLININKGNYSENLNNHNLIPNNNNEKLRSSSKINVSFHDNMPKYDAYINIPKIDEPLPDLDELSTESPIPLRNSLASK